MQRSNSTISMVSATRTQARSVLWQHSVWPVAPQSTSKAPWWALWLKWTPLCLSLYGSKEPYSKDLLFQVSFFRSDLPFIGSDEFNSNAMAGRLAYTMPSPAQLFNAPSDVFNGETMPLGNSEDILSFNMAVNNDEDQVLALCGSKSNCLV